uniref:SET domain-containing protein n=1 Tax=Caenorhabditis tropicalis TaxID=1561998 RepID=A0A1I7U6X9_9PELO
MKWKCMDSCKKCSHSGCLNSEFTLGLSKKLSVKPSEIAGNGLDKSAEADDFIAEYICPIIKEVLVPSTRVTASASSTIQKKSYAFWKVAEGMVQIGIYTLTTIDPGTELFFNYAYNEFGINQFLLTAPKDRVPKLRRSRMERENVEETEEGPAKKIEN